MKMIKSLRGVPGVQPERFQEAQNIQHCALSLVGEPILYPHINDLVRILHEVRAIFFSSYLTCSRNLFHLSW